MENFIAHSGLLTFDASPTDGFILKDIRVEDASATVPGRKSIIVAEAVGPKDLHEEWGRHQGDGKFGSAVFRSAGRMDRLAELRIRQSGALVTDGSFVVISWLELLALPTELKDADLFGVAMSDELTPAQRAVTDHFFKGAQGEAPLTQTIDESIALMRKHKE